MTKRSFHYHACAHALSGHLTRPLQHVIEVQAGTTLPTTGGHGSARTENFRFNQTVSVDAAYSEVSGSETKTEDEKTIHTTVATAAVEKLNILDVVTADRIVSRVSSSFEGLHAKKPLEGQVLLVGSKFENLRIAGYQVEVELDHELFLELGAFATVQERFKPKGSKLREMATEALKLRGVDLGSPKELAPEGAFLCSVVKQVHFKDPGFGPSGGKFAHPGVERIGRHAFHVVDFGDVFLAEVLCQHGRKTLTMLRVELGSPNGGGFVAAEAVVNGWPPWG